MKDKKREYKRSCKYCNEIFITEKKFSKVCPKCYLKNHKKKVENTLFNGKKK
jgi:Zn finger protein HypA/HybF involved in hydrogenase expression